MSVRGFVIFKALVAGVLGAAVTPIIALWAIAEMEPAPS